jgi:hypothetical protein
MKAAENLQGVDYSKEIGSNKILKPIIIILMRAVWNIREVLAKMVISIID